jgi:hypothetical protein
MKTWIVITEIFLLGLWVDDWGLAVGGALARLGRAIHDLATLTPTSLIITSLRSSNELSSQQWYCPVVVRPPPQWKPQRTI